jgi:nucleoside phosphorylase
LLFERHPYAIGGEMEGVGLAAAAERERCEWILVKGICDWADGEKSDNHQGFAAASCVSLVRHVLSQPGVIA